MKLLFCPICEDVFKLVFKLRSCECGRVKGMYIDNVNAVVNGEGVSVAIGNGAFLQAVSQLSQTGGDRDSWIERGKINYAWVRPHEGLGNPHTKVDPTLGVP